VNGWTWATAGYSIAVVMSFIPVLAALLRGVERHPGGPSFPESSKFSDDAKTALVQHYERLSGTLSFWKTQAFRYKRFHTYAVIWVTVSTVSVPFLAQSITNNPWSKWCVTVIGAYAALLLSLSRAFRVENNYKAFRQGESEFYDTWRKLLDDPAAFGRTEAEQLQRYFELVALIRQKVRAAETDNIPSIEAAAAPISKSSQ
jgi:hypothetical protein